MKNLLKLFHITGFLIFGYILYNIDWNSFKIHLSKIQLSTFLILAIGVFLMDLLRAERFRLLLELENHNISFKEAAKIYLGTEFWGVVTPGRSGEFIKAKYLDLPLNKSLTIIAADRGFDFLITIFAGLVCYFIHIKHILWINYIVLSYIILIILFLYIRKQKHRHIAHKLINKLECENFFYNWKSSQILKIVLYTLLSLIYYYFWYYAFYNLLLKLNLPFYFTVFTVSTISISNILPLTMAGIGTRESVLFTLASIYGFQITLEKAGMYGIFAIIYFIVLDSFFSLFFWYLLNKSKD